MLNIFAERLRSVRELRGWSQAELAQAARLQSTAVSHFETGSRSPSFDNLKKLADALRVSTDYLLGRSDSMELVGPGVGNLFRNAEKLSGDDLKVLEDMAQLLAAKQKGGPK